MVSAGKSLSSGADVRIVRSIGSDWVELDRVLDDDSGWNRTSTAVFFKIQSGISAHSVEDSYYLYHGCSSASGAPANPSKVYWYFNNFESSSTMSDWTLQFVDDSSNWQIVNGVLEQSGKGDQNDILPYVNDKVILTGRPKIRDIHVEVDYYTGDDDLGGFGLCSNDKSPTGFYVGMTADRWFDSENVSSRVGYWLSETNHGYTETSVPLPAEYDVQLAWTSSQVQSSFNGKQFSWGVGPGGANYFCMVLNGMSGVIYDNLVIRHYVNPEPSVKLGLEESRS